MGIDRIVRRAVFLDRDGVINAAVVRGGKPCAPTTEEDLLVLPGVPEALSRLRHAGFELIVATNQPDIARGTLERGTLDRMHARLAAELPLEDFRVCEHDDADDCGCRKPRSGLLEAAARERRLSLLDSFVVGDRWRDIEAGRRVGCTTIFIDYGYDERRPDNPDAVVGSLSEAADWILRP